jgi:prepilin-type processing-associated H-X9-DG protein
MDALTQDQDGDGNIGPRKVGKITYASNTIMLGESRAIDNAICHSSTGSFKCGPAGKNYEYTVKNGTIGTDPGKFGYHSQSNNWCFSDGHVSRLPWHETYTSVTDNLWLFR